MNISDFTLERYFARWEFAVKHVLCASDAETLGLHELLALASAETRRQWDTLRLGYTESQGLPALRAEIARLYDGIVADDVIVFAGAEEGVFLAAHALVSPGDHVIVLWPSYQSLHEVSRSIGADVTLLELDPQGWSLDLDRLRSAIRPNTRLIVVNYPHSPTGAHIDRATFDQLLAIVDQAPERTRLFSDEVYRFLELDGTETLPGACSRSPRAFSLGVMSKAFGLGGLRIGWIASKDQDLIRRLARLKDYTTICNSAPSEVLALIALRAREQIVGRIQAIMRGNLAHVTTFFDRNADDFTWVRPRASTVCFPSLRRGSIDAFAERLASKEGVLILPGSQMGYPGNHFRLGFGRKDMPQALAAMETCWRDYAVS